MQFRRMVSVGLILCICLSVARADAPAPNASPAPERAPTESPAPEKAPTSAQQALFRLLTGNTRFYQNRSIHANQGAFARSETSMGEYPFAIVLTCSDSRVPPEIIFDQGLGNLFVVRLWGNYVGATTIGSIQHGLEDHHPHLLVVLGHQKCGALQSVVEGRKETGPAARMVAFVAPAIALAHKEKGDLLDNACRENVFRVVHLLKQNPVIHGLVVSGELRIVPAYYHLDTGHVELLSR